MILNDTQKMEYASKALAAIVKKVTLKEKGRTEDADIENLLFDTFIFKLVNSIVEEDKAKEKEIAI